MLEDESLFNESEDKFHDECGVVGVFLNPSENPKDENPMNAASMSYFGLYSLQHRGQDSAGICVSDGNEVKIHKAMGLVSDVFKLEHLQELQGNIAIGHVRYATSGSKTVENAQPMLVQSKLGPIAVAHNGQLVNYIQLREMFEENGTAFASSSDTEVITKLITRGYKKGLERALTDTIQMIKGSFALCIMTKDALIGVRDPNGIRPLCLGQVENGWILASESCAIDAMNGTFVRDIRPGEIVIINKDGDNYSHEVVWDTPFEKKVVKEDFSCDLKPLYVDWSNQDMVILDEKDGIVHLRDNVTGNEGYIPKREAYEFDGAIHVYQFLSSFPTVQKGQQVYFCNEDNDMALVEKEIKISKAIG